MPPSPSLSARRTKHDVFERHHHHERPEDERHDPENIGRRRHTACRHPAPPKTCRAGSFRYRRTRRREPSAPGTRRCPDGAARRRAVRSPGMRAKRPGSTCSPAPIPRRDAELAWVSRLKSRSCTIGASNEATGLARGPPHPVIRRSVHVPPHDELRARACPVFAMVCLELVRVNGSFPRDRDRTQAYPLPPATPRFTGKSLKLQALATLPAAGPGASWADRQQGGIAAVQISVISRRLRGFEATSPPSCAIACGIGPNVARFLVNRMAWIADPDHNRPG